MKTLKNITTLISIIVVLLTLNVNASNFGLTDESYINDIPFSTKEVFAEVMLEKSLATRNLHQRYSFQYEMCKCRMFI